MWLSRRTSGDCCGWQYKAEVTKRSRADPNLIVTLLCYITNGVTLLVIGIATNCKILCCNFHYQLPPSWCHWRTDGGSERSKKKNTALWWFEKQKKMWAKGGCWRSNYMETTVYQSNIRGVAEWNWFFIYQSCFILFKHRCYPLQNSSLGQLHTDGDVPTFGSSAGILQHVR